MKIWEDMIAINSGREFEFETLPPAQHLPLQERSYVRIDPGLLAKPLEEYEAADKWPIPATMDRERYHLDRHRDYWLSGLRDYLVIIRELKRLEVPVTRYFELGCSSGRTLRHFLVNNPESEIWGADINYRNVMWLQRHIPPVRTFQNTSIPQLPLEDMHFDFVCAFSVFTHIETFVETWLAEIWRVLRPGGIAWLTLHTEYSVENMTDNWPLAKAVSMHPDYTGKSELLSRLQKNGRVIFRHKADGSYSSNVVCSTDFIKRTWGAFFEVVEVKRAFPAFQDVFLLRKPNHSKRLDRTALL